MAKAKALPRRVFDKGLERIFIDLYRLCFKGGQKSKILDTFWLTEFLSLEPSLAHIGIQGEAKEGVADKVVIRTASGS